MKTILVPTDFSGNARNAIDYAAALAEKMQARLVLFHAYWLPLYEEEDIDSPEDLLTREKSLQLEKQTQEEVIAGLLSLKRSIQQRYQLLQVEYTFSNGLPVDEILLQVQSAKVDLVVMGTNGASGVKEIVLGSNAADVIEKSPCPVLVIPRQANWQGIHTIVYASDYHENDIHDIAYLVALAALFDARLTIIHVTEDSFWASDEYSNEKLLLLKNKVAQSIHYAAIGFENIHASDIEKGLQLYAESHKADIVAMSTHKRSLLQKFFGKRSLTLQMAFHTHIPLLAFKAQVSED